MDGNRMFGLIEKLNFVRVSGTPEEKKAAEIIRDEAASFGFKTEIEEFKTKDGKVSETVLEVLEPYHKVYTAIAHRRSACVDGTFDAYYAEDALDVNLIGASGKAIYINTPVNKKNYARLLKASPACVIVGNGDLRDHEDETDLIQGMLRPILTDDFDERLCAVEVRMKDLFEMIKLGASKMRVKVVSEDFENTSRIVTGVIEGSDRKEEIISFVGHMDSTQYSHGCYDNAAGSALIMELARCFMENKPRRTLRFIWAGSEERGLLGSKYFVKAHEDEVKKTRLCVNCDLAGSIAGHEAAIVTGPDSLTRHIDMMMKEAGYAVETRTDTYSSDCIPFADSGVPAVSILRFGAPGMSYIHNRHDVIDYVWAPAMQKTGDILHLFATKMDGAEFFPVERVIPDEMVKKVDEYLQKKK